MRHNTFHTYKGICLPLILSMILGSAPYPIPSVSASSRLASNESLTYTLDAALKSSQNISYTLDDQQKDTQGIYYTLNSKTLTAIVGTDVNAINNSAYDGANGGEITLPDTVNYQSQDYTVTRIGKYAFNGNKKLYSIVLSDQIQSIGDSCFSYSSLVSVTLSASVKTLESSTFSSTTSLRFISVSEDNPYLCSIDNVLYNKAQTQLIHCATQRFTAQDSTYEVPDTVTTIKSYAFTNCLLTQVTLPASVTTIESGAFRLTKLTGIDLSHVQKVGYYAFAECRQMQWVKLQAYSTLEGSAFMSCSALEALYLPRGINIDSYGTFSGCSALKTVALQGTLTYTANVTSNIFQGCQNLQSIYLPADNMVLKANLFAGASALTDIYIPETITSLETDCLPASAILHASSGSAVAAYATSSGCTWINTATHSHSPAATTLFSNSYITLTGQYCVDCKSASNITYLVDPTGGTSVTQSPEPTAPTPSTTVPVATNTPVPTVSLAPTSSPNPTDSPIPTVSPAPTSSPVPTVSLTPTDSPVPTVSLAPTSSPVPTVSLTPTDSPVPTDTLVPTGTPVTTVLPTISPTPTATSLSSLPVDTAATTTNDLITHFTLSHKNNKSIVLSWTQSTTQSQQPQTYLIYRSQKKGSGYHLLKTLPAQSTSYRYTDKTARYGITYYYQIHSLYTTDSGTTTEIVSTVLKGSISGVSTPTLFVKKGTQNRQRYLRIRLKKAEGTHLEVYVKKGTGSYKKIALKTNRLKAYTEGIKLQYLTKNTTLSVKVRTYHKKGGKKYYSSYSNVRKVRT